MAEMEVFVVQSPSYNEGDDSQVAIMELTFDLGSEYIFRQQWYNIS